MPRSFAEYVASAPQEPPWIIDRLLPVAGLTVLVAAPKTGKSILSAQVAEALTTGRALLGHTVVQARKVLYVQLDAPPVEWAKQIEALGLLEAHTTDIQEIPRFFLDELRTRQIAQKIIREGGYDYVIWDALEKLTARDLNETPNMQFALTRLGECWGGPRLVIHHPRKPSGDRATDSIVHAGSGSKYLSGEASMLWQLSWNAAKGEGKLQTLGRLDKEREIGLSRHATTGLWLPGVTPKPRPVAPAAEDKRYSW